MVIRVRLDGKNMGQARPLATAQQHGYRAHISFETHLVSSCTEKRPRLDVQRRSMLQSVSSLIHLLAMPRFNQPLDPQLIVKYMGSIKPDAIFDPAALIIHLCKICTATTSHHKSTRSEPTEKFTDDWLAALSIPKICEETD